jgi:hypothetical protein
MRGDRLPDRHPEDRVYLTVVVSCERSEADAAIDLLRHRWARDSPFNRVVLALVRRSRPTVLFPGDEIPSEYLGHRASAPSDRPATPPTSDSTDGRSAA